MPTLVPVILCGGSGTRLWPLSRQEQPKQFVPVLAGASLLDLTLARLPSLGPVSRVLCLAGEPHRFMVAEACDRADIVAEIILEPQPRNTAPAIACAALAVAGREPEAVLVCLPCDHFIPDADILAAAIGEAARLAAEGWWMTLGVEPEAPSTAYGYIEPDVPVDGAVRRVRRFTEKPDAARASTLVAAGALWNSGIFVVRAADAVAALDRHLPATLSACRAAVAAGRTGGSFRLLDREAFMACESLSIDHAVLEKHDRVGVVPFHGRWSDVGSWSAFAAMGDATADGNRVLGDARLIDCRGTFVLSHERLTVAMGLEDLAIIDTPDALLVARKGHCEAVRRAVSGLRAEGRPEAERHTRSARPWGAFERIAAGDRYQVKRITVKPGSALSLQYHFHRAEHWVVVRGTARVTRGQETFLLGENESAYIPAGVRHRLENPGRMPLEIIEVQSGSYLGEDDIVRLDDDYGRAEAAPVRRLRRAEA